MNEKRYKNNFPYSILEGLSSLDFFVSLSIFVVFITVFISVAQIIIKFSGNYQGLIEGDPGLIPDQHKIYMGFDSIVDIISQPGFSFEEIKNITNDTSKKCSFDPSKDWKLIGPNIKFPVGYKICLSSTPLAESNYLALQNNGKPGIYVLHAIPNETSARYLPMRRIFCRPKPYC